MSIFRAIENRTYIVRAANTGYSCYIDPTGKIIRGLKVYQRGYLLGEIEPRKNRSFYTRFGDWFAYLCIIATIILIGLSRIPRNLQVQEVEKKENL
jgi:apolipoprotein N-acyltransferase